VFVQQAFSPRPPPPLLPVPLPPSLQVLPPPLLQVPFPLPLIPLSLVSVSSSVMTESSALGRQSLLTICEMPKEVTPFPSIPSFLFSLSPCLSASSVSGKMLPISRIVNSTEFSLTSDPTLSSDSILIKWRPVSAVSGIGSWKPSSHTILSIPSGGVLVSWLVSLLSDEIKGLIVKGE
jgi:hypothetical protein